MSRVTILLDDKLENRIRNIQADRIKRTGKAYSFSQTVNDILGRNLK